MKKTRFTEEQMVTILRETDQKPVAEVANVERNAAFMFARIVCKPLAGVNHHKQVLVVHAPKAVQERPADPEVPVRAAKKAGRGR